MTSISRRTILAGFAGTIALPTASIAGTPETLAALIDRHREARALATIALDAAAQSRDRYLAIRPANMVALPFDRRELPLIVDPDSVAADPVETARRGLSAAYSTLANVRLHWADRTSADQLECELERERQHFEDSLAAAYEREEAFAVACGHAAVRDAASDAEDAEITLLDVLIRYTPTSLEEVALKLRYLVERTGDDPDPEIDREILENIKGSAGRAA